MFGDEQQFVRLDELDVVRIVLEETEVVDGVAVDRADFDFFVVQEDGFGDHGARVDDMAVGEDDALLGVHHETRGHLIGGRLGIESARNPNPQHDDGRGDVLEHSLPRVLLHNAIGGRLESDAQREQANEGLGHSMEAFVRGSASRTFPARPLRD